MAVLDVYSYDLHLRDEDAELFKHADRSFRSAHRRARKDVVRDLLRRGVDLEARSIANDFAKATVTLTFAAGSGAFLLMVPAGTVVRDRDPARQTNGAARFTTDAELFVPPGSTGTVDATAADFGEPGNVEAGALTFLEGTAPDNFASVTNAAEATGGVDHELTRACTYRAMELVCLDLTRKPDDKWDHARKLYAEAYRTELSHQIEAGLKTADDLDFPGGSRLRTHGRRYFQRG